MLASLKGMKLSSVDVYVSTPSKKNSIVIFGQKDQSNNGDLLVEQPFQPVKDSWNHVVLDQPITIGDKEQALADLVRCYEKMMMRSHTNGGYVNLLDECWKMCEKFHTNIVIMYDHVSCKNVGGLHGLFEDQARERGIHLIWIPHDVMDPRTVSRREMREAFSQYMVTVLNEKPLDPTLLDYEDTLSW